MGEDEQRGKSSGCAYCVYHTMSCECGFLCFMSTKHVSVMNAPSETEMLVGVCVCVSLSLSASLQKLWKDIKHNYESEAEDE